MTISATTIEIQPLEISESSKSFNTFKVKDEQPTMEDVQRDKPCNLDTVSLDTEPESVGVESSSPEPEIDLWPQSFYCHSTHILLKDPVVGPDGNSVERSLIPAEDDVARYYPNRALQAIIEESILTMKQDLIRSSFRAIQKSVSRGLVHILPESTTANEPLFRPLNDALYCPITFNLMHQPVIDPEGNTFEKVAIENWIKVNRNSPITRTPLRLEQLYPNTAIQRLLDEEKAKPVEEMHPSIRKWKDEPVPMATDVELGGNALLDQQRLQQNPNADSTIIVITTVPYPTTPSEWEIREQARRRTLHNVLGLIFAAVCLTGFVMFGSTFFLMLFVLTVMILFSKRQQDLAAAGRNQPRQEQFQGGQGGQLPSQQQQQ